MATDTTPGYGNFVGGTFVPREDTFADVNPARPEDVVALFPSSSSADVAEAVSAAEEALRTWRHLSPIGRGKFLLAMGQALRARSDEIAGAITREQGKPLADSRGEVGKSIDYLDYHAFLAYDLGGRTLPSARPEVDLLLEVEPVGVVALVTPWNIPLAGPLRKLAPALVAGNTVVLKPSELTPLTAHVVAEAAAEAGLPAGVLNVVHGDGAAAGVPLVRDERVRAISFTGSTAVGREIARVGGERLARVQLELGGKNAAIVLDDADLEHAAAQILPAAFGGTGQQCTASSRVLVQRPVLERFSELLVARTAELRVGPGEEDGVTIGPLVSERQLETVVGHVEAARNEGAELLAGGLRLPGDGFFLEPTVFAGVRSEMRLAQEEIFGPVVALLGFDGDDEALALANDTPYGLSAAVYTRGLGRARRFVRELDVGAVAVNLPSAGWEIHVAFGGTKASGGTGWKEQGLEGLDFYCERKAVQILAL